MRTLALFGMVTLMSTLSSAQFFPAPASTSAATIPAVVTDPKQISSRSNAAVERNFDIAKMYMTRAVGGTAWSPDGKTIAFISNISGRNNLWLVPAAGGWPTQLTVSDQRQSRPAWSPNGKWIAYMSDYDGDEQWDIFLVSPKTGQVVNVTNTREIAEEDPTWSPDGRYLAYMVKPKTSSVFEIDVLDTILHQVKHITTETPADKMNVRPIWSRDGKWIAYTQEQAKGTDSNIYITEVETGKSTLLTQHGKEEIYKAGDFAPDGGSLLITSNASNGYENAGILDIASKKISWLTQEKWEVSAGHYSPDGKSVTWIANVDGNADIFIHNIAAGKTNALPLPKGMNELGGAESSFSRDGSQLLYYHNGATAPNDAWVYTLATGKSHPVTNSLVAGVQSSEMVEPYLVHFPSRDGKWTISAFVYVPFNLPRQPISPAIVYVHGGPASQSVNSFNRFVQYMANQGYIVIAPNYRGSTGYGKEFQHANLMDMGGGDLQDVLAAADWIKQTGYVDPKKLILMGGSYGGYLTMMGVTKAPDIWAAGVPIVPFVNWFTEIENEDPVLQQSDIATMGDPKTNKALYQDRSPIFFVEHIKAPLFLLAGGNDPRCPEEESQQVIDAVKKNGGSAELKVYKNEGHGFSRVENLIDAYGRVAQFLKAKVPPADCGCSLIE
jgi:dipeptidyl aminopeptidase/acylaminoacyl peptidase